MQSNYPLPPKQTATTQVASPCVGLCSTTYGDMVCRGCMRHTSEITNWPQAKGEDKRLITQKLDSILISVMSEFFSIDSLSLLQQALKRRAIPFDQERSPYAWLHKLLVQAINSIEYTSSIGVTQLQSGKLFQQFQQCRQQMYKLAQTSEIIEIKH